MSLARASRSIFGGSADTKARTSGPYDTLSSNSRIPQVIRAKSIRHSSHVSLRTFSPDGADSASFARFPENYHSSAGPIFSRQITDVRHLLPSWNPHTLGITMPRGSPPERRAAARYRLRLPVIFHWNDGTEQTEGGFTNDVALDGALILSTRCPPVGTEIRIEVLVPSPDDSSEQIRIECIGTVTRVWQQPGTSFFGVHGIFSDDQLTRRAQD
jgi:hypothetical protein